MGREKTTCIDRAGAILIRCLWVEKRLVDLICLKQFPEFIEVINGNKNFPSEYVHKRLEWWKKDFREIKDTFIKLFDPKQCWRDNLEGLYYWRNIIGHGHISLYRDYLLYSAADRVNVDAMYQVLEPVKNDDAMRPSVLLLNLADDKIYKRMQDVIVEFDEKYLSYEAKCLGIVYEKIR